MKNIFLGLMAALFLAGCQTTNPNGIQTVTRDTPLGENSTRIVRNNPDISKWNVVTLPNGNLTYVCRQLACASPSRIITNLRPSPTINPNPTALATLAKVETPRHIAAQRENGLSTGVLISSGVSSSKGYPSTFYHVSYTRPDGTKYYNVIVNIYAGSIVTYINSSSNDLGVAKAHSAQYISKLEIILGDKVKAALAR